MAARRLLIVMLVFLAISSVLAVFAPPPEDRATDSTTTTSVPSVATPGPGDGGRLLRRTIAANAARGRTPPVQVDAEPGDQVALVVKAPELVTIEIPTLGLTETAGPGSPARFDLYISGPGTHRVLVAGEEEPLAIIDADSAEQNSEKEESRRPKGG